MEYRVDIGDIGEDMGIVRQKGHKRHVGYHPSHSK